MSLPDVAGPVCAVGEGPRYCAANRWSWVDNAAGRLFVRRDGQTTELNPGVMVVAAVPKTTTGWLLAAYDGLYDYNGDGASPRPSPVLPDARFNDGVCDALGRFWVGTMSTRGETGRGALYCVSDTVQRMAEGFDVCNGIGFSPDNRWLYLVDTVPRLIHRYAFDLETGRLGLHDVVYRVPPEMGKPDGLAVDSDGNIWCALWDGAAIICITPHGALAETIKIPAPRPTSLAFGEGCMLVTTAGKGLSEAQLEAFPLSGRPLLFPCAVRGAPLHAFGC